MSRIRRPAKWWGFLFGCESDSSLAEDASLELPLLRGGGGCDNMRALQVADPEHGLHCYGD